jgi:hypothetical protein
VQFTDLAFGNEAGVATMLAIVQLDLSHWTAEELNDLSGWFTFLAVMRVGLIADDDFHRVILMNLVEM